MVGSSLIVALFYCTLGNIPPIYRSTLQSIQLFAVVKSAVLQKYGADTILEMFMDGIKSLERLCNNLFYTSILN